MSSSSRTPKLIRATAWLFVAALVVFALWLSRFGTRLPTIYTMSGPSMEPTLAAGDFFIAWSPADPIERGDLVIFRYEDEDGEFDVLRRVAGLPGDTVAMDSGIVILNGVPQNWPFRILTPEASRSELALEEQLFDWGPWVVPPDSIVLLSDTRDMVGWPDSRFLGFIPLADVLARVEYDLMGRRLR